MTKGQQQDGAMQRKSHKSQKRQRRKLSSHPAFAPILGIWGAALAGFSILVLPAQMIAQMRMGTGLMMLGAQAQGVLAGMAALVLGSALFMIANRMTRKARLSDEGISIVSCSVGDVSAIDPKRELGSDSLDDPLVAMPFTALAAPEPSPVAEPSTQQVEMVAPRSLDLAQFAQLAGRNSVWVEELPADSLTEPAPPAPEPVAVAALVETADTPPPPASPCSAAMAHLRALPTEELSIIQMVERFAAALHEHRAGAAGKALSHRELSAREAALAEALKALSALSGNDAGPAMDEPLRDALARLQGLRGAA